MPPLDNAKRERFCQEYVIDANAKQAAIRAGYSEKTATVQGSRLLTFVDVEARIAELTTQQQERTQIDADTIITALWDNHQRATQAQPLIDQDGKELPAAKWEGTVSNRALELLGKHLGMFVERIAGATGGAIEYRDVAPITEAEQRRRVIHLLETGSTEAA